MGKPDSWDEEVIANLPGLAEPSLRAAVERSLYDFCRRSNAWIFTSTLDVRADRPQYDVQQVLDGEAVQTLGVTLEGARLSLITEFPSRRVNGRYAIGIEPGLIELHPTPSKDIEDGLEIEVAYAPLPGAKAIPDIIADHWYDTVLHGIYQRLMMIPGKPWSNPQQAGYYRRLFIQGCSEAREATRKRYGYTDTAWRYPAWA